MKIPEKTSIITFIDKYFIRSSWTNETLTDEDVRVVYWTGKGSDTASPNVIRNMMTFDIYVKTKELHNIGNDRLMMRTQMIASRIHTLLTSKRYTNDTGYRFWPAGEWDSGTKTPGYSRYTIAFYYMEVY
jgi:hypothetical protein